MESNEPARACTSKVLDGSRLKGAVHREGNKDREEYESEVLDCRRRQESSLSFFGTQTHNCNLAV